MAVDILPLPPEAPDYILHHMREADLREVRALRGENIRGALASTLQFTSSPMAAYVDDELVCIFGIACRSRLSGVGHPWLVGTPAIENTPVLFLKRSRQVFEELSLGYRRLYNFVDARNLHSIQWLKWLGFTVEPAERMGLGGEMFHRFEMRRDN